MRLSVLAFIFSVPSPKWRRLGANITARLLLSILFSALLSHKRCLKGRPSQNAGTPLRGELWHLLETFWRKSKKWRRVVTFLSGSTQESSMVAEVRSSSLGSCWALIKASCSSEGNTGSGSSLKNCFTSPAMSQGSAVDRHSSPASSLAWTINKQGLYLVRSLKAREP